MIIHISNRQKAVKISKPLIKEIVKSVIEHEGETCDEVSIHFVSVKEICKLHADFFDDPTQTDCISLPLDDDDDTHYRVLGEVFVCPETALQYAKAHQKDPFEEMILYVVHGLLHLMGYDDIDPKDRKKMRMLEKKQMAHLKDSVLV